MASHEERRRSFDGIAQQYAVARPQYPEVLIDEVIELSGIPQKGRILEIGPGPGTASVAFAAKGYRMVCLEPGSSLAEIARERLAPWPEVAVHTVRFEDWPLEPSAFDMVLAASSIHWIDPEVAYTKSAAALRPQGAFVLLRNRPVRSGTSELWQQINTVYEKLLPPPERSSPPNARPDGRNTDDMRDSGLFTDVVEYHHEWEKVFSAEAYIQLLETYSDHQTLPPETKAMLYAEVRDIIFRHGGTINLIYDSYFILGRKGAIAGIPGETNTGAYNRWSSFYDEYPNPTVAADEMHFPALWQHLRGKRVIEVGCGTGRHTVKLSLAGNDVVAVDPSHGMLSKAREKLAGQAVEFIEGDFLTFQLPRDCGFDAVIASLVLEHIRDLRAFFVRCAGLLHPAGELFLSEIHPDRSATGILAHFKDPLSNAEVHLESYAHTAHEIETAARSAGFTLVATHTVSGDENLAAANPKWSKYLGLPMVQIWNFQSAVPA